MGRRGIELEVKFAPVGEATLADLAARADFPGWRVVGRRDEAQRNTYYDTAAGALEAARCSLRRRVLDDGVEWTFKRGPGPGRDGVSRRREINALLPLQSAKAPEPPKCEPVRRAVLEDQLGAGCEYKLYRQRCPRRADVLLRNHLGQRKWNGKRLLESGSSGGAVSVTTKNGAIPRPEQIDPLTSIFFAQFRGQNLEFDFTWPTYSTWSFRWGSTSVSK